ncbi:MAG: redoxin domain-containing protein [Candidatus Dormibacteraeota bacterium]|nr:redoxin domain-containing protein [Candidatus Dormibacteraeota bacterium]
MTRFRITLGVVVAAIAVIVVVTVLRPASPPARGGGGTGSNGALAPASQRPAAPGFTGLDGWVNTAPLTLTALRGHVVLIDFWTFSCVNCVRTIPHLQQLDAEYKGDGLVIVGVHSPEFDFEKSPSNVRAAVQRLGVTWPVAIDSQMATWNAYQNEYWPAEYLLDQQGRIAYTSFGEGDYDATSKAVAALLSVHQASPPAATEVPADITPELYAGSERGVLADGQKYGGQGEVASYPDHGPPQARDAIQVTGSWVDHGQYLEAVAPGHVRLNFHADSVYVVAGSAAGSLSITVTIDGKPVPTDLAASSLTGSAFTVSRQDLFALLTAVDPGTHLIDLSVPAGFQLYTFTFG